jgi:ABC-type antimicrobial peptide transport system permease subunit
MSHINTANILENNKPTRQNKAFLKKVSIHIMFQKLHIIFAIVILVLLPPTSIHSASNENFYCQDGTSQSCCTQLAHKVSSDNNSRCASIVLINNSGYNMTLGAKNLEDGRWLTSKDYVGDNSIDIDCQPHPLLVNESETISSVTSHFFGGIKGYVIFNINDNMLISNFTISWKVPAFFGSPEYDFGFHDISSYDDYNVDKNSEFENTVYKITITNKHKPKEMPLSTPNHPNITLIVIGTLFLIIVIILSLLVYYFKIHRVRPPQHMHDRDHRPLIPVRPPRHAEPAGDPTGPAGN